jgi:hypothetical protein
MDNKDELAAMNALMQWFASQNIAAEDAVPMLVRVLAAAVIQVSLELSEGQSKEVKHKKIEESLDLAAAMLRDDAANLRNYFEEAE